MIRLNIDKILGEKGKSRYWLWKQLGTSYGNFAKMANNETKMIRLETIEALCLILECTPNELFVITDD